MVNDRRHGLQKQLQKQQIRITEAAGGCSVARRDAMIGGRTTEARLLRAPIAGRAGQWRGTPLDELMG
jgi:hypothetical protein